MADIPYSAACPTLPKNRPFGYPHIIDTDAIDEENCEDDFSPYEQNVNLADSVATYLWNRSEKEFKAFFNLSEPEYVTWRKRADMEDFVISRQGRNVTIGFREADAGVGRSAWDLKATFYIQDDGKWIVYEGADDPDLIEMEGVLLAEIILLNKMWAKKKGVKFDFWVEKEHCRPVIIYHRLPEVSMPELSL